MPRTQHQPAKAERTTCGTVEVCRPWPTLIGGKKWRTSNQEQGHSIYFVFRHSPRSQHNKMREHTRTHPEACGSQEHGVGSRRVQFACDNIISTAACILDSTAFGNFLVLAIIMDNSESFSGGYCMQYSEHTYFKYTTAYVCCMCCPPFNDTYISPRSSVFLYLPVYDEYFRSSSYLVLVCDVQQLKSALRKETPHNHTTTAAFHTGLKQRTVDN